MLVALTGLALSAGTSRAADDELFEIDPILRGKWMVHAISEDRGLTVSELDVPRELLRATRTTVRFTDEGDLQKLERILISEDDDGNPAHVMKFTDGSVWIVTKKPDNPFFLVQEINQDTLKETIRIVFTVE